MLVSVGLQYSSHCICSSAVTHWWRCDVFFYLTLPKTPLCPVLFSFFLTTKVSSFSKTQVTWMGLETPHLRKRLSSSDQSIASGGTIPLPSSSQGLTVSSHHWKSTFLTDCLGLFCIKHKISTTCPCTETASLSQSNCELRPDRREQNFYLKSNELSVFSGFLLFLVYLKISFTLFLTLLARDFLSRSFFFSFYTYSIMLSF